MKKPSFTEEQLLAINERSKTLLVSAAAGSGKTATLTERIIRSVLDSDHPISIRDMLIVTFTNAAVDELTKRIGKALKDALAADRENEWLKSQLRLLPSAKICTIDAFCNDILKNNAESFGITPSYRIADLTETQLLSNTVFDSLTEGVYAGELSAVATPEEFERLCDSLTSVRAEGELKDVFSYLYEKSKSLEEGVFIYRRFAKEYDLCSKSELDTNKFILYAIERAHGAAKHFLEIFKLQHEFAEEKNAAVISDSLAFVESILSNNTYVGIKDALNRKLPALPRGAKAIPELEEHLVAREEMKASFKKLGERYFVYEPDEWRELFSDLHSVFTTLASFLEKFDEVYFEEKRRRGILEYSDIERLALMSLYDNGEPNDLALSLRERFEAVYIDEYQDVNALQDKIFRAVSRPDNRFMVGDIKQSIYGFRSAKPEIFSSMKKTLPAIESSDGEPAASVFMSRNFRCDRGVVDFVNQIFDTPFTLTRDSIGYTDLDRLKFSKIYEGDEPPYKAPEVTLFDKSEETKAALGEEHSEFAPRFVAKKIKELLDTGTLNSNQPIRPSDIAIILRKGSARAKVYKDALAEYGIKANVPEEKDFFLNADVQLALCLLNSIDNPHKDIYLSGLMLSPIFGFTPDELLLIRKNAKKSSLWLSTLAYLDTYPDFERGQAFVSFIEKYRSIAEGCKVGDLIMRLYKDTKLLPLAMGNGGKKNLLLLYNYARQFEASSYEGLYSFINYVNTAISSGVTFSSEGRDADPDAVTVMTVHKSKGLEFPVVFLADAGASLISPIDKRVKTPYSEELGVAMRIRMKNSLAIAENPVYNVISDYNSDKIIEEELRVYYVGLTRARERLYVVGVAPTENREAYLTKVKLTKHSPSPFTIHQMKTFVDILLLSLEPDELFLDYAGEENVRKKVDTVSNYMPISDTEETCDGLSEKLVARFGYEYPRKLLTHLPEKLSISKLHPAILDNSDNDEEFSIDEKNTPPTARRGILPEFISGTSIEESARRGIATHNFLQFFNIDSLLTGGAQNELTRLVREEFISAENEKRVRLNEIELFKSSTLLSDMKNARKLYREFRFNVFLPASLFTEIEEKKAELGDRRILMQGVIDCLYEDASGNLHLVDYKTDRLTREELADKALAQKTLSEKHSLQLSYYAEAVKAIFGKAPASRRVYSLPLGDTVDV